MPAPAAEPLWEADKFLFSRKSSIWISSSDLPLATCVSQLLADMSLRIWSFSTSCYGWSNTETARGCNIFVIREVCDFWQCEVAWVAIGSGWSTEYFFGLTGGIAGVSTIRARFWLCTSDHSLGPAVWKLEMSATALLFGIAAPACWPDLFWGDVLTAQIWDVSERLLSLVQPSSSGVPCWSFVLMGTSWWIPSADKTWLKGSWEWVLGQVRTRCFPQPFWEGEGHSWEHLAYLSLAV